MSAQALADRCAELGHPLDRSVIAKLEKGYRATVTLADLLALAAALEVSPLLLLLPFGEAEDAVEALPGRTVNPAEAYEWITGQPPPVGPRMGWRSMPPSDSWDEHAEVIAEFMDHRDAVQRCVAARCSADVLYSRSQQARQAAYAEQAERLDKDSQQDQRTAEDLWDRIRQTRKRIRRRGLTPPVLPDELAAREPGGADAGSVRQPGRVGDRGGDRL
jgi:transcriptional regulator with XRE-family HTH domain